MEQGHRILVRLLIGAAAAGLLVLALHPMYRGTIRAWRAGRPGDAPILRSNDRYAAGAFPSDGEPFHGLEP